MFVTDEKLFAIKTKPLVSNLSERAALERAKEKDVSHWPNELGVLPRGHRGSHGTPEAAVRRVSAVFNGLPLVRDCRLPCIIFICL